jgi:hypothetical protein
MCRNPLGATEAPAKRPVENWMFSGGQPRMLWDIVQQIQQELGPEPVQPPPPPRPPQDVRIINIGDGVQVSEGDVTLVMQHAEVTRGEAVRALRRYDGDIVNSILMLTSPDAVVPRVPVARDPMVEASDDQATAWFLQRMFGDGMSFYNSHSDMLGRMNYTLRRNAHWQHEEHNDIDDRPGYESA